MIPEQETFDTVARHLLSQGRASMDDFGFCHYRGAGNRKCAVGCLIPDEQYTDRLEDRRVGAIWPDVPALRDHDLGLLSDLQRIHDTVRSSRWIGRLRELARDRGLSTAVLDGAA